MGSVTTEPRQTGARKVWADPGRFWDEEGSGLRGDEWCSVDSGLLGVLLRSVSWSGLLCAVVAAVVVVVVEIKCVGAVVPENVTRQVISGDVYLIVGVA